MWLAATDTAPLGLLALQAGFVSHLYVEPEVQRSGVGCALLAHAKSLFPDGLELYTHQSNVRARAFYERFGFRPLSFGVSPPPECEPDVRYGWAPDRRKAP